MRKQKKYISIVVLVAFLLTIVNVPVLAAEVQDGLETATNGIQQLFAPDDKAAELVQLLAESKISGVCGENATWTFADGVLTISGTGAMDDYVNPPVRPWWEYRENIVKIVIEDGITEIGANSFAWSSNLVEIELPQSLKKINKDAFSGCKIEKLDIPANVIVIEEHAFSSNNIDELIIPDNVIGIGECAFYKCGPVTTLTIGNGVTDMKGFDCSHNPELKKITIGNGITEIPNSMFEFSENLSYVKIGDSVKKIGKNAFEYCTSLKKIEIPESVEFIGHNAFNMCTALEKIIVKNRNMEFSSLGSLTNKNITLYGYDNSTAEEYSVQAGIPFVTLDGFNKCGENLTWKYDEERHTLFIDGTGVMYDYENPEVMPWYKFIGQIETVIIGNEVTQIDCGAFFNFELKHVVLGDSLSDITGFMLFDSPLESIVVGKGITEIFSEQRDGSYTTLSGCHKLKTVKFLGDVKKIRACAFDCCNALEEIELPESVEKIESCAFADNVSLKKIVIYDNIKYIADNAFENSPKVTIYGYSKSYAESYAKKNHIPFVALDKPSSGGSSGGGFSGSYNYPIKTDSVDGATVSFDKSNAVAGDKVVINVTPDNGKQVDKVIVTDSDNKIITVTRVGDNKYNFIMPEGAVKVSVTTVKADYDTRVVLQIGNKNVVINDRTFSNDVAPVIVADRTMVPIRVITEALGGKADWNEATRTVTLTIDGKVLRMTIDKTIPGFDAAPVIVNSRTYVPIRYVAEALGADVEWIKGTQQIIIEK